MRPSLKNDVQYQVPQDQDQVPQEPGRTRGKQTERMRDDLCKPVRLIVSVPDPVLD